jgi:hypothetical protein
MKRVCSIFSQVLQLIPRDRFEEAVKEHKAERHARGFNSRGQFVAMLFCQLAQAKSLREITEGLQASEGKLKHLGLPEAPARSTLAYANGHRPRQLYKTVFHQLLADCRKRLGAAKAGSKLGLPGKLLSLDATVIDLCAAVFDWAQFRTTKGAVKLPAAGSRRLSALLRRHHGGQGARDSGGAEAETTARHDADVRSRIYRLQLVPAADRRGSALRDAAERECHVPCC